MVATPFSSAEEYFSFDRAFTGTYSALSIPPEKIKELDKREKYVRQVKEAQEMFAKADRQRVAKVVRSQKGNGKVVKDFLVDLYSMQPFATSELESLLNEHKVDEAFAKEILDAVKEMEKDAPPPTDFRTWQTSDGLFKAKAKFVSSENNEVTIEKENGQRETLPFDEMRWSDKNFVRYQLALAEAKQPPVLRTWRSSDGEHEIKATYVSGDAKTIYLKREDGTTIEVEVALLAAEDQEYVQLRLEAEKEAKP
jgi:hypothetical protein